MVRSGDGFRMTYVIPHKDQTNIPTTEQIVWIPPKVTYKKDKSGRIVRKVRKGYSRKQKIEISNLDRERAIVQEGGKPRSSANSSYRVVELVLDYNFGNDFPNFLQTYLKSKGWGIERKK